jgi:uncharacterized protein
MRILRIFAVMLFVAGATDRALADDAPSPDALAAATELMSVLSPDMINQLTGQMFNAFWADVEQKARASNMDADTVNELHQSLQTIVHDYVVDTLKLAPPIYAKHFTAAEMHDIIAFYQTPTGAKALRELPRVMGEFTTQMVPHLQDLRVKTADAINDILRKHGYAK